ncbi:MAG: hypothetical protein AAB565_01930 [Patescibacteria group bacterium]
MNNILSLNLLFRVKKPHLKLSLKSFYFLSTVLLSSLLVFYIFQVTFLAKETFLLQNYQKRANELARDNENLEVGLSQGNSLEKIGSLVGSLNFEKSDKVRYLQILEGQVVSK